MANNPLFVVADIHGHRAELAEELRAAGLVDRAGKWNGQDARLWLLGDYVDRGPDGTGVIDDIRALEGPAAVAGGEVRALLGNHEAQLLAAYRFGTAPVPGWDEPGGFRGGWARFGGREHDLAKLTPDHVAWILDRPAVAMVDGYLLVHSDTARYLEFGSTVDAVNTAVAAALRRTDSTSWLEFCDRMSDRGAFRDAESPRSDDPVSRMLRTLGGEMLVHGHSTLTKHFGVRPEDVEGPLRYAGDRVLAIDGGVYEGGRILLTQLAQAVSTEEPVADLVGLTWAQENVLDPLEDSPQPLWELGWSGAPTPEQVAFVLRPGLISLVNHGLVEVRRFPAWPADWEHGVPVIGADLLRESGRADAWRPGSTHDVLAAHITAAGIRWL